MTRIQHSTNPDIFVGTPEEFGLATTGDFSCPPDHWIASYKGRELDLVCRTPEDAFAEAERYAREQAESRSSGKGKSPLSDAQAKGEVMLSEFRHALNDGLGAAEGEAFELACLHHLGDHKNVGVAWMASQQRVYLLFGGADRPEPEYVPIWLLDMAKELTLFLRTFVVPDQRSAGTTFWGGVDHGPIVSYRFKLADSPTSVNV